jgi:hypothetical protein
MVTTKSKLQMEFNKEVTSASSGLVSNPRLPNPILPIPFCRIPYCRLLLKMTKFHHIIFYLKRKYQKVTKLLGQKVTGQKVTTYIFA